MIDPGLETRHIIGQKRRCLWLMRWRALRLFVKDRKRLIHSTIGLLKHGVTPEGADIKGYLKPDVIQADSYVLTTARTWA